MKKILMMAASLVAFAGCVENKPNENPVEKPDSIELSSSEYAFTCDGGTSQVLITSSGKWELTPAEEYSWISADAIDGEDGDIVTFRADANTEDVSRSAEFVFTAGKAEAKYKVVQSPTDLPELELNSDKEVVYNHEAQNYKEILVYAEGLYYQDFKVEISEEAQEWLHFVAVVAGESDSHGKVVYDVDELTGLDDREGTITISMLGTKAPVAVKVTQEAKHVLSAEPFHTAEVEGGVVKVPVVANVKYSVEMASDAGTDWITHDGNEEGNECFTVQALGDNSKRAVTVTLTQTDAAEGEEPLVATFSITQQPVLIEWAAQMKGNRLFPKWEGGKPGSNGLCSEFTYEMLFRADDFNKQSGQIFTLLGIEGQFLVRLGDKYPLNRIHLSTGSSYYDIVTNKELEPGRWYHLAVAYSSGYASIYLDGEVIAKDRSTSHYNQVNIAPDWSYEPTGNRCFWVGYSYEANRDFYGQMTEIRIWTRKLTEEEINADGHFYDVDPKSDGLFAYWKFTKGEGNTIEDLTGNGNPLYGETNVRKQGQDNKGDDGIEFVPVSLPEK